MGMMSPEHPDSTAGHPVPFGPFLLERRLAVGGSAEVYLARPRIGSRPAEHFVVKRLIHGLELDTAFEMLNREAELHQTVRHPNVVQVFGAGQVDGEPYLAMEYVQGCDLYRLLRRLEAEERTFAPEVAIHVARTVADALVAVHSARDETGHVLGLVHRDVTPSNVYLSLDGDIKLGDFGIARVTEPRARPLQPTIGLKGKFGYLSPEQIAGESFDHRADLFALTVILGEMLIGERIFPGSGQLAVLLAIRDGNIEPLQRKEKTLPPELYRICLRGLARDPAARFQSAAEFSEALRALEQPNPDERRGMLARWVVWASDSRQLVQKLQGQIRDSVERMRAVRIASASSEPPVAATLPPVSMPQPQGFQTVPVADRGSSRVRFAATGKVVENVGFPLLIEMVATGEVRGDDEVALLGEDFRRVRDVETLERHLMPSTTAMTARLFEVGVPDYQTSLTDESMLTVLARLRILEETGALFVERRDKAGQPRRKEIYVKDGRLLHVASSERDELLGEYLVRRGSLSRTELDAALARLTGEGGRLGDTLVSMGLVDAVDVFRAIRDQGRDRVAALCNWSTGVATFYRGTAPLRVGFPLDLDLASPMMAGVFMVSSGQPRALLPAGDSLVLPGPRAPAMASRRERGAAPLSLVSVQRLATEGLRLDDCLQRITAVRPAQGMRQITEKEAAAAFHVAHVLGWVSFEAAE